MTDAHLASAQPALAEPARCPLHEINPFDPAILVDPYPYFARLRAEAPVFRDPKTGIFHVASYELIREVNAQPRRFSNDFGAQLRSGAGPMDPDEMAIMMQGLPPANTLLTADPPVHTRFRKLVAKAFAMKRVEGMADGIARIVTDLLDEIAPRGFSGRRSAEFKTAFADRVPMTVIADALGVPRDHMGEFKSWSDGFIVQLGGVSDKPTRLEAARKIVAFQRYFLDKIEEKRASPTEDIISDLVHVDLAEEGDHRTMTPEELISIFQQLLVAGNETTAHALAAGLYYLIRHPEQQAALRADPALVDGFVEETLRHLSPTNNMWRVALEDTDVGGVTIPKGALVLLRYGSGNRDDAHFPGADRFEMTRENARDHLAFGAGIHTCIAAPLARKELQIAFPLLLERMTDIRLEDPDIVYAPNVLLRGVAHLNVSYAAA
jgi:cytochrome P450